MSNEAVGWTFRNSPYTGNALVLHLALADVVNDMNHHELFIDLDGIAVKGRCSRSTARRVLTQMVDDGYLEYRDNEEDRAKRWAAHRPTRYVFLFPDPGVHSGTPEESPGVPELHPAGCQGEHPRGVTVNTPKELQVDLQQELQPSPPPPTAATAVFDAWQSATGHTRAMLTTERARLIERRVKAHGLETVLAAARGVAHSPWHMGENPNGQTYNSIELVLRNAEKIELFAGFELDPSTRPVPESKTDQRRRALVDAAETYKRGEEPSFEELMTRAAGPSPPEQLDEWARPSTINATGTES